MRYGDKVAVDALDLVVERGTITAVLGPNGASPREAALVVALAALGVPWLAATAAVTIKATLAWLPALTLGGISLLLLRRQTGAPATVPVAAL